MFDSETRNKKELSVALAGSGSKPSSSEVRQLDREQLSHYFNAPRPASPAPVGPESAEKKLPALTLRGALGVPAEQPPPPPPTAMAVPPAEPGGTVPERAGRESLSRLESVNVDLAQIKGVAVVDEKTKSVDEIVEPAAAAAAAAPPALQRAATDWTESDLRARGNYYLRIAGTSERLADWCFGCIALMQAEAVKTLGKVKAPLPELA